MWLVCLTYVWIAAYAYLQSPGKTSIRERSHNSFIRSLVVWWCRAREEAQRVAIFPQAALGGREPLLGSPKSHQAPPSALIEVLFHWSRCSFGRTSTICNGHCCWFEEKQVSSPSKVGTSLEWRHWRPRIPTVAQSGLRSIQVNLLLCALCTIAEVLHNKASA